MSRPVLPLSRWHSVSHRAHCNSLLVNVHCLHLLDGLCLFIRLKKWLRFVEVMLSSHARVASTAGQRSFAVGVSGSGSSAVEFGLQVVEIIEVVEHEVHVFLLFSLQMVYDALVFVHFDADVCVRLPRNGPRLDKAVGVALVHVVTAQHILLVLQVLLRSNVGLLLAPADVLVVELAALFLELVVTDIKRVSAHAVVAHPHLVRLAVLHGAPDVVFLLNVEVVVVGPICVVGPEHCVLGPVVQTKFSVLSVPVICVHVVGVLRLHGFGQTSGIQRIDSYLIVYQEPVGCLLRTDNERWRVHVRFSVLLEVHLRRGDNGGESTYLFYFSGHVQLFAVHVELLAPYAVAVGMVAIGLQLFLCNLKIQVYSLLFGEVRGPHYWLHYDFVVLVKSLAVCANSVAHHLLVHFELLVLIF